MLVKPFLSVCIHLRRCCEISRFVGVHNDNNSWLCFTQSQVMLAVLKVLDEDPSGSD